LPEGRWSPAPIPKTDGIGPSRARRKEQRRQRVMFTDYQYVLLQDRSAREQDLAGRMAERRRYARSPGEPSLRARLARRLFALAVAAEREETWRQVWERFEARGRL
jgi:hypothetical protein